MSTAANKATVRRLSDELWNKGNLSVIDELIAADIVVHNPTFPGPGREGVKQWVVSGRTAFPDCQLTLADLIAEGDKVALRWTFRGTHQAELLNIPPTGYPLGEAGGGDRDLHLSYRRRPGGGALGQRG